MKERDAYTSERKKIIVMRFILNDFINFGICFIFQNLQSKFIKFT